ncbi:MAG: BON domain-containing protein [Pirellulales bacterium]|jgi:osmotically-inducible protein OsmY|nr:BON domain-containing protein [Pirellulales bacterium]
MHSNPRDTDLERRVTSFLFGRHLPGLRHIEVEARDGVVTLRGRVRTFYEKQICHQCCRRVAGVLKFIDAVDVDPLPAEEQAARV